MWRHIASNALTFFVVALFLVGGLIAWGSSQYSAPGPLAEAICLRVESGSNMRRVARELESQGAVSSPAIFRMGVDYAGKANDLKAGSFRVDQGASMEDIADIITRGGQNTCGTEVIYRIGVNSKQVQVRELDPASNQFVDLARFDPEEDPTEAYTLAREDSDTTYNVVLAEGVTSWQVTEALNDLDVLTGEIAAVAPEGTLAPDSYEFRPGDDRQGIIDRMTSAQSDFLASAWANRADDLPLQSPEEALILASIVEKETGVAEERRQVASVFVNRLNRGMRLQTDPTVIYGITKGEGVLGRGLRQSELRRETPWNTYVIPALPPTPIANPGRESILAALDPDQTEYIFFVADGSGGHAFATNLDDHNANVARWRVIEAERAAADGG